MKSLAFWEGERNKPGRTYTPEGRNGSQFWLPFFFLKNNSYLANDNLIINPFLPMLQLCVHIFSRRAFE